MRVYGSEKSGNTRRERDGGPLSGPNADARGADLCETRAVSAWICTVTLLALFI